SRGAARAARELGLFPRSTARALWPLDDRRWRGAMSLFEERRGLYAIVDPAHTGARSPLALAEAIVAGGPALFQYRDKTQSDRDRLRLGRELRTLCRRAGIPFIVNDRLDLALLLGADGAHLGQEDLPIEAARRIAPSLPLGRSTHS